MSRPECSAYIFLEGDLLQSGSVSCPEEVWALEGGRQGGGVRLHRRPRGQEQGKGQGQGQEQEQGQGCGLFIHTDPTMWRYLASRSQEPR